jgi:hypothetical protein
MVLKTLLRLSMFSEFSEILDSDVGAETKELAGLRGGTFADSDLRQTTPFLETNRYAASDRTTAGTQNG